MSKLKRLAAPSFWPIETKTKKYAIMPKPGPHSLKTSMPLGMVLRDVLKHAETLKEARAILNRGLVKVNGRTRKDHGFPVGFMDIIEIGDDVYRMLAGKKGLHLGSIGRKEAFRLLRVENKVHLKNRKIQLNLHDGSNIVVEKDDYKTGDVIAMDMENKIKSVTRFEKDAVALIAHGKNTGAFVTIKKIIITKSSHPNIVVVSVGGKDVPVPKDYVFVVGKEKPIISL